MATYSTFALTRFNHESLKVSRPPGKDLLNSEERLTQSTWMCRFAIVELGVVSMRTLGPPLHCLVNLGRRGTIAGNNRHGIQSRCLTATRYASDHIETAQDRPVI